MFFFMWTISSSSPKTRFSTKTTCSFQRPRDYGVVLNSFKFYYHQIPVYTGYQIVLDGISLLPKLYRVCTVSEHVKFLKMLSCLPMAKALNHSRGRQCSWGISKPVMPAYLVPHYYNTRSWMHHLGYLPLHLDVHVGACLPQQVDDVWNPHAFSNR